MDLSALIQQGQANPVFLIAAALFLGALHGLEPGHSKTMMAAFIIAVRGTVSQAIMLGVAAAFSHSIIVWVLAILALIYGDEMIAEDMEPWFMMISGLIIIIIAAWIFWQVRRQHRAKHHHEHHHKHHHHHDHDHDHNHDHLSEDAHAQAHARQIEKRFTSGQTSNGQIIWFGLSGGLIPCPAAVTVLIVCLHLQQFWLGIGLVSAFSIGLALTLVAVGVVAAWSAALAARKSSRFDAVFANAPYLSSVLIAVIGMLMLITGFNHLSA